MTYRIDCNKPEVSISSQFLKLSGLPASQPASQPNRVYKRILYLQKCAKNRHNHLIYLNFYKFSFFLLHSLRRNDIIITVSSPLQNGGISQSNNVTFIAL
jgi:hypothetical protein